MRTLFFLLLCATAYADDLVDAKSSPRVSFSPSTVTVTAHVQPSEKNQWIEFRLSSEERGYQEGSGETVYAEDDVFIVDFDDLMSGNYICHVYLVREGKKYRATTRFKVVKGAQEQ